MSAKENPMNKTIISILIWLVCMPCMAAAETSKKLEEAKEEAKKEASALFDTNETEADTSLSAEDRQVGGMGILLMRELMDVRTPQQLLRLKSINSPSLFTTKW